MSSVLKIVLQRLGLGLLTLFAVSIIIAFVVELLPGDITQAILGQSATPETVAAFRKEIGLDRPAHIRYFEWLGGMVQGDLGQSLASKREISEFVGTRLSNTLFLGGLAAAIAVPLALILGLLAALYRNSIYDRIVNLLTLTSISFPEFFVAYILILFLSVKGRVLSRHLKCQYRSCIFGTIVSHNFTSAYAYPGRACSYVANDTGSDY